MITFGLITEGLTDQIVIDDILTGYFGNSNIVVRPLQPQRDKDDENKSTNYGGWSQVFQYCQSSDFENAFQSTNYIIIQIDTDVSEDYNVPKQDEDGEFSPQELIAKLIEKFIILIGEDFYREYEDKIIFAISVHSIECWLLPLYYTDNRKSKIKNCLDTLNQGLARKEGFTIDVNAKNPEYYREISRQYCKPKILMKFCKENPSLKIFVEEIQKRNIVIEEDY